MCVTTKMPKLLAHVGFKTTADHFDEPDFDPDAPDREVPFSRSGTCSMGRRPATVCNPPVVARNR
jgi:hypothetical protein